MTPSVSDVMRGITYHKNCGGKVTRHPNLTVELVQCERCDDNWARFELTTGAVFLTAFQLNPVAVESGEVVCWKFDPVTRTYYASCVPVADAAGLERVKV